MNKRNILAAGLSGISLILMLVTMYLVFIYVPTEKEMGFVQRIFYLMVPMGWLAILSFVIIFIASILYLASRKDKWDILGHCAAELGIMFTTLALITGSIWARPIWGVWWTWEPRLTATLVLWFIYLAYFIVPSFATEKSRAATFAAVIGILGFIDVPIIGMATSLWRGMHPPLIIFREGGIDPRMLLTVIVSVVAFTALFSLLLMQRVSLKNDELEFERLQELSRQTKIQGV
ncbi:MAG: cytochrome c biogenesis protein CcsA [Chloroflexi bacterium]|nr:cytochrome c biogenesis protein CcsA [Chloroflexota bacterium]